MKYSAELYAKAFAAAAAAGTLSPAEKTKLVKNFLAAIAKNNDTHELAKIYAAAEKMLREKTGVRKIVVESARKITQSPREILGKLLRASDMVETKIDPALIAGIKIIVNDDEEFDGSLARKLQKLFNSH